MDCLGFQSLLLYSLTFEVKIWLRAPYVTAGTFEKQTPGHQHPLPTKTFYRMNREL